MRCAPARSCGFRNCRWASFPASVARERPRHRVQLQLRPSPADVYSLETEPANWIAGQRARLVAWTPEVRRARVGAGEELRWPAHFRFVYRRPAKFPGKRPVLVNIHGGPESQSRPIFQARNNYYLNELGVASFPERPRLERLRQDFLDARQRFQARGFRAGHRRLPGLDQDAALDPRRLAVMGGSYGGYMTLACMTHFSDRLRCGMDIVGISNFLTFLKNTQDYRRDLRRVEYGDERDPAMAEFLAASRPTPTWTRSASRS